MTKEEACTALDSLIEIVGAIEVVGNSIRQRNSVADFESIQLAEVYLGNKIADGFLYERKVFSINDFKEKRVIADFEIVKDDSGMDWGIIHFIPKIFFSQPIYKK